VFSNLPKNLLTTKVQWPQGKSENKEDRKENNMTGAEDGVPQEQKEHLRVQSKTIGSSM
jgi:hypothetical protein